MLSILYLGRFLIARQNGSMFRYATDAGASRILHLLCIRPSDRKLQWRTSIFWTLIHNIYIISPLINAMVQNYNFRLSIFTTLWLWQQFCEFLIQLRGEPVSFVYNISKISKTISILIIGFLFCAHTHICIYILDARQKTIASNVNNHIIIWDLKYLLFFVF